MLSERIATPTPRSATLVVIEFGASWPRWLEPARGGDMAVVAQHYEGEPSSLITQVASRVTRVAAMGWQLDAIVLVCNDRTDSDAVAARSVICRGLLAGLKTRNGGEFVLTAGLHVRRRSGRSLIALAAALDDGIVASGVTLEVRAGNGDVAFRSLPRSARLPRAS
jgi:hypothetical protein